MKMRRFTFMSVTAITVRRHVSNCQEHYAGIVARWTPDSRGRLQEAALNLYAKRGFDQTTAAQIAQRAGLTERTFFRHFADKREVLFGGFDMLREQIVAGVAAAPKADAPMKAIASGLDAAAEILGEGRRDLARTRLCVIAESPELRERELAKFAECAAAVAAVLHGRGVGKAQATMAAEAAMSVLRVALQHWAEDTDDGPGLPTVVRKTLKKLRTVI